MWNLLTFSFAIFFSGILRSACSPEKSEPWDTGQLMPPKELASVINDTEAAKPLIVCIGQGALIKGSLDVGQTREEQNLEKLRTLQSDNAKDEEIVLYCGCCPFVKCPNIRPALSLLIEMGVTTARKSRPLT